VRLMAIWPTQPRQPRPCRAKLGAAEGPDARQKRDRSAKRYVYVSADGIYLQARLYAKRLMLCDGVVTRHVHAGQADRC
jgi:hypothetical protein